MIKGVYVITSISLYKILKNYIKVNNFITKKKLFNAIILIFSKYLTYNIVNKSKNN